MLKNFYNNPEDTFSMKPSTMAWHLFHWFHSTFPDKISLEECIRFCDYVFNLYKPQGPTPEMCEEARKAFDKAKTENKGPFKMHKCEGCGSIFTRSEEITRLYGTIHPVET